MATGSIKVNNQYTHHEVELNLKWNRLWSRLQNDIMANQNQSNKVQPSKYSKSYFGDVFNSVVSDFNLTLQSAHKESQFIADDLKNSFEFLKDFYNNLNLKENESNEDSFSDFESMDQFDTNSLGNYLLIVYNRYAEITNEFNSLTQPNIKVYSPEFSDLFEKYFQKNPKLPRIYYNDEYHQSLFDNNLILKRRTLNADNLFKLIAEYRNELKEIANEILESKMEDFKEPEEKISLYDLYNKEENNFKIVGHVFNRRNILTFNGESKTLKSKCKYLLTHELTKNKFSVILNQNTDNTFLGISALGQPLIEITDQKAFINGKQIALPYLNDVQDKGRILVKKNLNSISVQVNNDLLVICYQDSKSCSISLNNWFTGKVNGLLGRSSFNLDNVNEDYWYLDKTCKLPNIQLKKFTNDSLKVCYSIFGKNEKSIFKNAVQVNIYFKKYFILF